MSELSSAIKSVCDEKGLDYESVLNTIELSLAAAYRKDYGHKNQNIKVEFDPETADTKVMDVKTVVEDLPEEEQEGEEPEEQEGEQAQENKEQKSSSQESPQPDQEKESEEESPEKKFNPKTEIQLSDARMIKEDAQVGDEIKIDLEVPDSYGRMAAQTAKQVIIQKLRESEREMIYNEFKEKEEEVVNGIVQRREGRNVLVDLGNVIGYLPAEEQIPGEKYKSGERIKVYIKEVELQSKGPRVTLSRTSKEIVRALFYLEIPELNSGIIEIKGISREAGSRSKVAVWADSENIDPIGSCVGQKGARIQTIITELGGEKVDIIEYDEDPAKFVSNALSPAKVQSAEVDQENGVAYVKVDPDQFSLAIGKRGENIKLASALTGWKINVQENEEGSTQEATPEEAQEITPEEDQQEEASEEETPETEQKGEEKAEQEETESSSQGSEEDASSVQETEPQEEESGEDSSQEETEEQQEQSEEEATQEESEETSSEDSQEEPEEQPEQEENKE